MRKIYFSFLLILCAFLHVQAQNVNVTSTAGTTNGSYLTLKAAFDAINAGTHQGTITIDIASSTAETSTAVLNASGTGAAFYSSILVKPSALSTISGNIAGPLIDLNGADNVTIDGRIGAAGSTKSLTITNLSTSNTAATSTVRYINDASNNVLNFATIQGSATSGTGATGVVLIDSSTLVTGNDNITISNNDIGSAGVNAPWCAVYSIGESATLDNNNINVTNNSIHDFFASSGLSSGLIADIFSTGWTIASNSFYQTSIRTSTASTSNIVIYLNTGNGFNVTGNYIGGSATLAGGGAYTINGPFSNYFVGIYLNVGTITPSNLNGNNITNINLTSLPTGSVLVFNGIRTVAGNVNIGTSSGNTIGALTGTGSITVSSNATVLTNTAFVEGIITSGGNIDIRNNVIGSITISGISTAASTFRGIETSSPTALNIQNNTVGGTTAASIQCNTVSGSALGILNFQGTAALNHIVNTNTIRNIVNNATSTNTASVVGIQNQVNVNLINVINTITNNNISNLSSTASTATAGSVQGIVTAVSAGAASSTSDCDINNNQISSLVSASTGTGSVVRGISQTNAYPNFLNINNNQIFTLSSAAPNVASTSASVVQGISSSTAAAGIVNMNGNEIYDLENTASAATHVMGIGAFYGSTTNSATFSKNKIYNLRNPNATATGLVSGIVLRGSASAGIFNVNNNMISLSPANVQVYGIHNNATATTINTYFNSIYIGGAATGTNNSGAFFRNGAAVTTGINLKDNILYNVRTAGGSNYSLLNNATTPATGWSSDYNDLYTSNAATVALWGSTPNDLATYKSNSGDANSKAFAVNFQNPITGDLHLSGASIGDPNLKGTTIAGITTDYDVQLRGNTPYIGADEIPTNYLPVEVAYFTGRKQANGNSLAWKASCTSPSIVFEIERSSDGRSFSTIGRITASQARCDQPFDYADMNPASGVNYYRLKMTESSGALKYSAIIAIANKATGFDLVGLYPTLITNSGTLSVAAIKKTNLELIVSDASGRTVLSKTSLVEEGSSLINFDFSVLKNGVYHLTASTEDGFIKTIRFVKQ